MANYNRVILVGNLTQDPELRYIPSGSAVVNFTVAINRVYSTASGERKEDTSFIPIVVWGKQAENCNQYLNKGRGVLIEGRLQQRSWETPDGQKRSVIEVVADKVQFMDRRAASEAHPIPDASETTHSSFNNEAVFHPQDQAGDEVPF